MIHHPHLSLTPFQRCKVTQLDVKARSHNQNDLEPFTEYQVNVSASIRPVEFDGPPATTFVRTCELTS